MDTPRKETLLLIHNERLSHFQKLHSSIKRTRNCHVNQPWAMRTAFLSSSFGNKSFCKLQITPNSALLTHPGPSWNYSPQNTKERAAEPVMRYKPVCVVRFEQCDSWGTSRQPWRTASPCSCGRCAPYRSQQSVPRSDWRRGSWRHLKTHYCPWTDSWFKSRLFPTLHCINIVLGDASLQNMIHSWDNFWKEQKL